MHGPEGVAARVAGWLRASLPAHLRAMETRLSTPTNQVKIPDPVTILDYETGPLPVEEWPAVYVLPRTSDGIEYVDVNADGGETLKVVYTVRVLTWVRAETWQGTERLKMRYALAVRECLLARKSLIGAGSPLDPFAAVNPGSIRENYGEPILDDAGRTIAGAWVDVQITATETTLGTPVGVAGVVTVDTALLPPHPAFE